MTDLVLDPARSRIRIHTSAEGLLARLAHDLELAISDLSGKASGDVDVDGAAGTASLEVPLRAVHVTGILGKDGRVDEHGLSPAERRDIVAKMQKEVFHAGPDGVVRAEAHLDGRKARIKLLPPNGKTFETVVPIDLRADGDSTLATGSFDVSLKAIGSDVVKGPVGAFRVSDKVRVTFDLVFSRVS